jgi:glycopeptide antibiotics resistance protein
MEPLRPAHATRAWRAAALACVVGALALVLVPWGDFQNHSHWTKVVWVPFAPPVRVVDAILNVVLFVPLGAAAAAYATARRVGTAVVLGCALSLSAEFLQIYSHNRFPSTTDVSCNVLGAAVAAFATTRLSRRFLPRAQNRPG